LSLLSPQLEAFMAVSKQKTVHGAASILHITQTAVTQRIRNLEARLSSTLFIRTRRGMMLTPEGEALLRYCHAVTEFEGETLAKIQGTSSTAVAVNITGPTSLMRSRIIPQCLPVFKKFPFLLAHFDINDLDNRVQSLRSGASQFALIREEDISAEMEFKKLASERYLLVCTHKWKTRKLKDIIKTEKIIDYDASDQMTYNYLKQFHLFELAQHERHFANRTESLAMLISAGLGYGVLTTEFSKPYLQHNELIALNAGKMYENKLALAWYARPKPPAYFDALVAAIK
jgi:LysR family transcriptional regulator, chromosome initiation inhibitor